MVLQGGAGEGVERREGLVHEEHLGLRDQRPHDGDALGLTARKFARPARPVARQAHLQQGFLDEIAALARGQVFKAEAYVLGHRQPGQQARLLKHDAHSRMGRSDGLAIDAHRSMGRRLQPADEAQQGSLAAARAAH